MDRTFVWEPEHPPISFLYNGQSSGALLPKWKVDETIGEMPGGQIRHYSFNDPVTNLCVTAHVRTFKDSPAVEWMLNFTNRGRVATPIIEDIFPLDTVLPLPDEEKVSLHYAKGSYSQMEDFLPVTEGIPSKQKIVIKPVGGRPSTGVLPFMNLEWNGGGFILAVGWSGQWVAAFDRGENLRVFAGMEQTHLRLLPGEQIRTLRILLIQWNGDDPIYGNNLLRKIILAHYTPRIEGETVLPPVAHNTMFSYYKTKTTNETYQTNAIACAANIGIEAYWLDACWYGSKEAGGQEVGNWYVNQNNFPRGLKPLGDAAHKAGMKFVLWFEPERVQRRTKIKKEHPEFLLHSSHDYEHMLFNLGNPEARIYMTNLISRLITDYGVDIYRQDFNFDPLPYWQEADSPDRVGMTEIRHIEGLYSMWDELRHRHPKLAIDNCASGGRRIDLETTSRSFPLWRSDFSDVGGPSYGRGLQVADQVQTAGLSRWVPLHSGAVWTFTPYDFRSAMSYGIVPYCDIQARDFPVEDARRAIRELKRLRPLFLGDFYPLLPLTVASHDWCAYQFDRPDLGRGFAVFLRRHESPFTDMEIKLMAIDSKAEYDVGITSTFDDPPRKRMPGAKLAKLTVTIPDKPGSVLLYYSRI